ncbi:hypothetical protein [Aquibacillus sediminis]|uniref:hypothetical protein n=1 Tax=Aquibacillus sediminis TaxID=2574734 RepID=UPI0011098B52|nr:hypothetical protein [Aquibacillus sediminis]
MRKDPLTKHEAILWNIALPGFSQLLNGNVVKGFLFVFLEIFINVQSNFNLAILYSFNGKMDQAIDVTVYQWLMFYPCLYMFALWDGFCSAEGEVAPFSYLPFVFGAFFVTIGLMYGTQYTYLGRLIGPVFLPMIFLIPGLLIGGLLRKICVKVTGRRRFVKQ